MLYIAAHAGPNYRFSKTEFLLGIYFKLSSTNTYFGSFINTSSCLGSTVLNSFKNSSKICI